MKFLFVMIIAIILPGAVLAQSNYHAGYVLKTNGDTLRGYINYREWEQSPKSIDFKLNGNDKKVLSFSPGELKGFQINGFEIYISYTGKISMDKTHFPDIPNGLDTTKQQDTIFLRQIVTGKYLTLYYNADNIKVRFFVAEANTIPVELIYHQFYDDLNQIVTKSIYAGQLNLYYNKYHPSDPGIENMINGLAYDQDHLKLFINKINGEKERKIISSQFYLGIAINSTISKVNDVTAYTGVKSSTTFAPKIDFGIDLFNNPQVQQLIFRTELSFSYVNPHFYYPGTVNNTATNEVYEFNQYSTALTPQLLLNVFNKEKFKFYIDLGLAFNFSVYSNDKFTIQNEDEQITNAYTQVKPYTLQSFWTSFPIQAGIVLNKRLEFYINYTSFVTYTQYTDFYAGSKSFNAGFKFLLH